MANSLIQRSTANELLKALNTKKVQKNRKKDQAIDGQARILNQQVIQDREEKASLKEFAEVIDNMRKLYERVYAPEEKAIAKISHRSHL